MESSAISSSNTQSSPVTSEHQSFKPAAQEANPAITPGNPSSSFAKASGNTTLYKNQQSQDAAKPSPSNQPAPESQDDLVPFATPEDERRYRELATRIKNHPLPNARQVAKEFIKERLGVDGDTISLAHFPNDEARAHGKPDSVQLLTDAVMDAFTGLQDHGSLPAAATVAGGVFPSPGRIFDALIHGNFSATSKEFSKFGNPFNVDLVGSSINMYIATHGAKENLRDVDEAYGLFKNNGKGYVKENSYELKPSEVYDKFRAVTNTRELPYIKALNKNISNYWKDERKDWPTAARMACVAEARNRLNERTLRPEDYKLFMEGMAPGVPLKANAPVTFEQISTPMPPDPSVTVQRLDINGYQATNIYRVKRADGSGVMYAPGSEPPIVPFRHKDDELNWIKTQANDPAMKTDKAKKAKKEALLGYFPRYDRMDGTFHSGVETGLDKLVNGSWAPAYLNYNDHTGKNDVKSDVFEDMATRTENRLAKDAYMETNNAWDGWKKTINNAALVFGPLGGPVQMGLGIDTVSHPKNADDLKDGVINIVDGAIFTAMDLGERVGGTKPGGSGHYDVHKAEKSNVTGGDAQGSVASDAPSPVSPTGYQSRKS